MASVYRLKGDQKDKRISASPVAPRDASQRGIRRYRKMSYPFHKSCPKKSMTTCGEQVALSSLEAGTRQAVAKAYLGQVKGIRQSEWGQRQPNTTPRPWQPTPFCLSPPGPTPKSKPSVVRIESNPLAAFVWAYSAQIAKAPHGFQGRALPILTSPFDSSLVALELATCQNDAAYTVAHAVTYAYVRSYQLV